MNANYIEDIIRSLYYNEGISFKALANEIFLDQPQNKDIKKVFRASKYYKRKWEWHQLVRTVIESYDEIQQRQDMYQSLLNLIRKHRGSYNDYFELKTEYGTYHAPNPIADLNRLEILFEQYLNIYQKIINRVHFNILKNEYSDITIRGRINWSKTIQKSNTELPLIFMTNMKEKEFVTSENILLILCSEWMFRESNRLLQISFPEPLSDYNINILNIISKKTRIILAQFPFRDVLNISRKFWGLDCNDFRITSLENEAWLRFKNKLIYNPDYKDLLTWIEQFRELNISSISASTPTRHILESIKNIDTVYEAWIFMEFVDYLSEKGILVKFKLNPSPYCQFSYRGKIVTFWYEKTFSKESAYTWALEHKPDFTAMMDDKILLIFDAKNYSKSGIISHAPSDTINKMLAYMLNLNTNFGVLILPNHPINWDDLSRIEKEVHFNKVIKNMKLEMIHEKRLREKAKDCDLTSCQWEQLPNEFKDMLELTPVVMKKLENTKHKKKQILYVIRFSPKTSNSSVPMKKESLEEIFKSVIYVIKKIHTSNINKF